MTNETDQTERNQFAVPRGRLLALDLGAVRTGVAVSDELQFTVRPLPNLGSCSAHNFTAAVRDLVRDYEARGLVLGLPLRMDGSIGDAAQRVCELARQFEIELRLPIFTHDERLTSREAEETLRRGRTKKRMQQRRQALDGEAAAIILRDFISTRSADSSLPSSS